MYVYRLRLDLQDMLYFASRELGRDYISEQYIHNYALTYALGLATSSYHDSVQVPHYREDLQPLNERGIYVTPAKPLTVATVAHTFKFADTRYQVKMEQSSKNIPTFGRIRELAPESRFEAFVFAQAPQNLPTWIRLGKWMSKAKVETTEGECKEAKDTFTVDHPLNALDVPLEPQLFDLINMPPVSLIDHARFEGGHYKVQFTDEKSTKDFPKDMEYGV